MIAALLVILACIWLVWTATVFVRVLMNLACAVAALVRLLASACPGGSDRRALGDAAAGVAWQRDPDRGLSKGKAVIVMSRTGKRLIEAALEAAAIARGDKEPAHVRHKNALLQKGGKARDRGALPVSEFMTVAKKVWPNGQDAESSRVYWPNPAHHAVTY